MSAAIAIGLGIVPSDLCPLGTCCPSQAVIGLLAEMHCEAMCHFGECAVADHDRRIMNDEVHLVRTTPYAQDLVGVLLVHEHHKSAFPSGHGVLTVRADQQQLVSPRTAKLVEQLVNHLVDVYGRVVIIEWDDDQMDVEQVATDTDADAHVKE